MMETLGAFLQRTRVAKKLSLEEVIARSKINPVYLQALESNDWSPIPSEVFARGFVKLYARCLGLDEAAVLGEHAAAIHAYFEEKESKSKEAEHRRAEFHKAEQAKKRAKIIGGGLIIVVLTSAGALFLSYWKMAHRWTPVRPNTHSSDASPPRSSLSAPAIESLPAEHDDSIPSHELILKAHETTWAQVLIDDKTTREVLLQPGDIVTWNAETRFKLDIGNAGGVGVILDGRELEPLGRLGEVKKGIVLPKS